MRGRRPQAASSASAPPPPPPPRRRRRHRRCLLDLPCLCHGKGLDLAPVQRAVYPVPVGVAATVAHVAHPSAVTLVEAGHQYRHLAVGSVAPLVAVAVGCWPRTTRLGVAPRHHARATPLGLGPRGVMGEEAGRICRLAPEVARRGGDARVVPPLALPGHAPPHASELALKHGAPRVLASAAVALELRVVTVPRAPG